MENNVIMRLLTIILLQVETTAIPNSGARLDLTMTSPTSANSFTKNGTRVTSTCSRYNNQNNYLLPYLFDHTFGSERDEYFLSSVYRGSCSISIELDRPYFVNNIRVFPVATRSIRFKVGDP